MTMTRTVRGLITAVSLVVAVAVPATATQAAPAAHELPGRVLIEFTDGHSDGRLLRVPASEVTVHWTDCWYSSAVIGCPAQLRGYDEPVLLIRQWAPFGTGPA